MRTLVAFIAGALVAAGVALFTVRNRTAPEPAAMPVAEQAAPAQPQAAEPASVAQTAPQTDPTPLVEPVRRSERPAKRPNPVEVAKHTEPVPAPVAAAPAEAPEPEPYKPETPIPAAAQASTVETERPSPLREPAKVTIPAGTLLNVRLGQTLSSERDTSGDAFTATLTEPLVIDGFEVASRGARLDGRVVESDRGGRVKGVSSMAIHLTSLKTSDGQKVSIQTDVFEKQATASTGKDAAKVGAAAALGAAIGAIAGGGKGAAIGAGVGGAAGTGGVLATRGKPVELPVETKIGFRLSAPVTVTEQR